MEWRAGTENKTAWTRISREYEHEWTKTSDNSIETSALCHIWIHEWIFTVNKVISISHGHNYIVVNENNALFCIILLPLITSPYPNSCTHCPLLRACFVSLMRDFCSTSWQRNVSHSLLRREPRIRINLITITYFMDIKIKSIAR